MISQKMAAYLYLTKYMLKRGAVYAASLYLIGGMTV